MLVGESHIIENITLGGKMIDSSIIEGMVVVFFHKVYFFFFLEHDIFHDATCLCLHLIFKNLNPPSKSPFTLKRHVEIDYKKVLQMNNIENDLQQIK